LYTKNSDEYGESIIHRVFFRKRDVEWLRDQVDPRGVEERPQKDVLDVAVEVSDWHAEDTIGSDHYNHGRWFATDPSVRSPSVRYVGKSKKWICVEMALDI